MKSDPTHSVGVSDGQREHGGERFTRSMEIKGCWENPDLVTVTWSLIQWKKLTLEGLWDRRFNTAGMHQCGHKYNTGSSYDTGLLFNATHGLR